MSIKKFKLVKIAAFLVFISLFFAFASVRTYAIEYGGIGGRPAFPDKTNPRTESIFVHELKPGEEVKDGVVVVNNSDEKKTLLVYAADSTPSSGGGFACKQLLEPKTGVGAWISLAKSEVTLQPKKNELVKFVIKVPEDIEVGEHNGCILIQEKIPAHEESSGVNISLRTGLRVAVTIPGKIVRKLEVKSLSVSKSREGFVIQPKVRNAGNVSIDANIDVVTKRLLGFEIARHGGQISFLRDELTEMNYEVKRPFWGGIFRTKMSISYDQDPAAVIGVNTDTPPVKIESEMVTFVSLPTLAGFVCELLILAAVITSVSYFFFVKRRKFWIENYWRNHVLKRGENISMLARKYGVSWKMLARVNKLTPPYQPHPGTKLLVPPSRGAKSYTLLDYWKESLAEFSRKFSKVGKHAVRKRNKVILPKKIGVLIFILLLGMALGTVGRSDVFADTTNLNIVSCDVNDLPDATCLTAISADGPTSYTLVKGAHIDALFTVLLSDSINSATLRYDSSGVLSGTWAVAVKATRDGTTLCSIDPAPENASETTNSLSCTITPLQLATGVWLQMNNNDAGSPESITLDYVRLFVDYVPPTGVLSVDIVDGTGASVTSPSVSMSGKTVSFSSQTSTGTLGTASEKIRVDNPTINSQWTLSIAAGSGSTATWISGGNSYDFNDSSGATDGGDADSVGGQMTLNPSVATITPKTGCTNTGLSLGGSSAFSEGTTNSITLVTAGATAGLGCYWDLTGVSISQSIPAGQSAGSYSINMTVTVVAN